MCREKTQKEIQTEFLELLSNQVDYWASVENVPSKPLESLICSVLALLDGCAVDFPAIELILSPHPEDKKYRQENGEDWWPEPVNDLREEITIHGENNLHDLWYPLRKKRQNKS